VLVECFLKFHGALDCFQRARESHKEGITHRLYFTTVESEENRTDEIVACSGHTERKLFIALSEGRVAHNVPEHNGSKSSGIVGQNSTPSSQPADASAGINHFFPFWRESEERSLGNPLVCAAEGTRGEVGSRYRVEAYSFFFPDLLASLFKIAWAEASLAMGTLNGEHDV
jgi:hypothetical protein